MRHKTAYITCVEIMSAASLWTIPVPISVLVACRELDFPLVYGIIMIYPKMLFYVKQCQTSFLSSNSVKNPSFQFESSESTGDLPVI